MGVYNLKYNKDDSIIRHVIIGLLADLNDKIYIMNQIDNDTREKVDIPFYFSFSGDEDVLYDYFLLNNDLTSDENKAIGNYDVVPRGIISIGNFTIDSSSLTNKYTSGKFQRNVDGNLKSFVSKVNIIPLNIPVECKIYVDTKLDIFRVTEKIITKLYKNNKYEVDVGHVEDGRYRIPCNYKLPEDYDNERPIDFAFDDDKRKSIIFDIELNTYIPVFDRKGEMFSGNRMFEFKQSEEISNSIIKNNKTIGKDGSLWDKVNK